MRTASRYLDDILPCPRVIYFTNRFTFDKQFEPGVEEEGDKMPHLEYFSLWVRNTVFKK